MKKRNVLRALGFAVILWGAGVYSVNSRGYASCTPETGFRGLMDKILFAPRSTCNLNKEGNACRSAGSACTTSILSGGVPTNVKGQCTTVGTGCSCVFNQ